MISQVKDPLGTQIHDYRDKTSEKFEFMAQKRGLYRFCFTNKSPYHETIDFDVYIGHFSYFEQHAKDGKTLIAVLELVITLTCDECCLFSPGNLSRELNMCRAFWTSTRADWKTRRSSLQYTIWTALVGSSDRSPSDRYAWWIYCHTCSHIFLFAKRVKCHTHWFAPPSEWIIYTTISHHRNFHIDFHNYYWRYSLASQAWLILNNCTNFLDDDADDQVLAILESYLT